MTIKLKLGIMISLLALLIFCMFYVTWNVTEMQKKDALKINLAGRQMMLSQKMTKELMDCQRSKNQNGSFDPGLIEEVKKSLDVFEITLSVLINSGQAPLSLDMKTSEFVTLTKAEEPVLSQLKKVEKISKEFSKKIGGILKNQDENGEKVEWILENNLHLLNEMGNAVEMFQEESEGKFCLLIKSQIIGVLIALCMTIMSFYIIFMILKDLEKVKKLVINIGLGDFTGLSNISSSGELGMIGKDLDIMVTNLKIMFSDISQTSGLLNDTSQRLASISLQMKENSESVSVRAHVFAAAVEEMSVNSTQVAESAEKMTSTITAIDKNSERARDITEKAVVKVNESRAKVSQLGIAATEIGKFSTSINKISEQTNLLALNATIEAARVGIAGKGFAVVAGEIKELAIQTSSATSDISEKIVEIQNSTKSTINYISDISNVINDVNDIVYRIAEAVKEQSSSTIIIADNVAEISSVANEITSDVSVVIKDTVQVNSNSHDVKKDASDLAALASELKTMVGKFKI